MKHSIPLVCRLLALAALWPALSLGQEPAPAAAPAAAAPAAPPKVEFSKKGADTCLSCHDDAVVLSVFHSRHGQPADARSPFGKGQLQCEACHGPGGNHTKRVKKGETRPPVIRFGRDSAAPVSVQNGICLACHEMSAAASWHVGPHAANDVSCAACHASHAQMDAVLATRTLADVCYACHVAERGQGRADAVAAGSPTAVFLMVGINDVLDARSAESLEPDYVALLSTLRAGSPATAIVVQSILPIGPPMPGEDVRRVNGEVRTLNARLPELAARSRARFVDVAAALTPPDGSLDHRFTSASIHLNGSGYLRWTEAIRRYVGSGCRR